MSPYSKYCFVPCSFTGLLTSGVPCIPEIDVTAPWLRFILYGTLLVVLVALVVISQTRNLNKTRKLLKEKEQALDQIEKQKFELETRDKNLTDSLIYAQRIQEALLPSEEYFRRYFNASFIFFKPKDIVSGDFYWIGEKKDKIFVVAADCTGHGVPGALMSMIGLEIIDKAINEDNIESPAVILDVMNRGLEKTFSREKNLGTIIRDGMDIGLCMIDRKKRKIVYSGAFFPLYLIRDNTLTEIKGDKIIIGMNPERLEYASHEIDLMEDDIVYIFSDGYVDQFGGDENKKFMYRRFRYLLTRIHTFAVEDQKSILEDNIKSWMAGNPQLDDMMVLGFKPLSGNSK
ncbi:MAG: SpoIIE family protein phosphatase [Bacteroidia bacterium]|nr:SpoIIE family protein phosphatase [Bacteroidia bacterium]